MIPLLYHKGRFLSRKSAARRGDFGVLHIQIHREMESFRRLVEFLNEKFKHCVIVLRWKMPYTIGVATKYNVKGKKYMNIRLGEKLKSLRREKNISQEKLAQFLNVSFQAVTNVCHKSSFFIP